MKPVSEIVKQTPYGQKRHLYDVVDSIVFGETFQARSSFHEYIKVKVRTKLKEEQ